MITFALKLGALVAMCLLFLLGAFVLFGAIGGAIGCILVFGGIRLGTAYHNMEYGT